MRSKRDFCVHKHTDIFFISYAPKTNNKSAILSRKNRIQKKSSVNIKKNPSQTVSDVCIFEREVSTLTKKRPMTDGNGKFIMFTVYLNNYNNKQKNGKASMHINKMK